MVTCGIYEVSVCMLLIIDSEIRIDSEVCVTLLAARRLGACGCRHLCQHASARTRIWGDRVYLY